MIDGFRDLTRITEAARERNIQAFRSEFLAWNDGARELFKSMSDVVSFTADGTVAVAEYPISRQLPVPAEPDAPARPRDFMDDVLKMTASRMLQVRRRFATLFSGDELWGTLKRIAEDLTGKPDA